MFCLMKRAFINVTIVFVQGAVLKVLTKFLRELLGGREDGE